jgi:hypothetical protein
MPLTSGRSILKSVGGGGGDDEDAGDHDRLKGGGDDDDWGKGVVAGGGDVDLSRLLPTMESMEKPSLTPPLLPKTLVW